MSVKSLQCPAAQPSPSNVRNADGPLSSFDLRGFHPSPYLSEDENYMDIVMIITRTSKLRQGSMGCILVQPTQKSTAADADDGDDKNNSQNNKQTTGGTNHLLSRIIAAATNTDLFHHGDSDVHAEINAIGQVAKHHSTTPLSTEGVTAYITMPPCKNCFGALHASGIERIVSRRKHPDVLTKAASKIGIEMSCLTRQELEDQKVRLDQLFAIDSIEGVDSEQKNLVDDDKAEDVIRRRKQRKEEKQARKMAKIAKDNSKADICS